MAQKARLLQFLMRTGRFKDSKEALQAISEGKITVAGKATTNPRFEFRPSTKKVTFEGQVLEPRKGHIYIALNKPVGIISQKNDAKGRESLWDFLKRNSDLSEEDINSLISIGRLDIDTEGLIILTTDGSLKNRFLQPGNVEKQYIAAVEGFIEDDNIDRLTSGVDIYIKDHGIRKKVHTLPAKVKVMSRDQAQSIVSITITEGKKRQVRHMFSVVGHAVKSLKRIRFGNISLGSLEVGSYKVLKSTDLKF